MCRLAAYLGPPVPVSEPFFGRLHGLERQAYAPREMVSGTINVDGTGVAWWREDDPEPLRYATTAPPWADSNLQHLAGRFTARTLLASVRSATPGIPSSPAAVLPFVLDGLAGTHNGYMSSFREVTAARCLAKLPEDLVGAFETLSDSLAIFLLAVAARREDPDLAMADALIGAVGTAARICADAGAECSLNVVLATGDEIVGVRAARGVEANSLYVRDDTEHGGGAWVVSEPLDDESTWEPVPPDHMVRITSAGATVHRAAIA